MFSLFVLYKKHGKKRFLQFKLNLIQPILQEAHIDVDISKAGHNKYVGRHYPDLIPPTENKDEKIVDINAKYVRTTLAYVLPLASKNMKNAVEGVTQH